MDIMAMVNDVGPTGLLLVYGGTVLILVLAIIMVAVRRKKAAPAEGPADKTASQTKEAEDCIRDLQKEIGTLKDALTVAESKAASMSGDPETATQELMERIERLVEEKRRLEGLLQDAEAERESVSDKLQAEFQSLKDTAAAEKKKLEELLQTAKEENKSVDKLQNELLSVKERAATAEAEKKKLQDKLEEAEEEIEDLEDELDKKAKKHKEEVAEKEKQIGELQEAKTKVDKELADSKQTIKKQGDDLSLKGDSLGFVREILKAREVEDKERVYQKVDELADYIKDEVQELVEKFGKQFSIHADSDLFSAGLEHWKQIAKKDWLRNKRTVAFVGEFSAGKTSIVNKILEASSGTTVELPVSTKATTAIPTYISQNAHSKGATFQFFTPDNKLKSLSEAAFKKVSKEILDQVDGVSKLIKYFIMTCNNPQLNGLSILDTPGFTSTDLEDTERTIEVINECDALFWVFDVNAGEVNKTSLNTIKSNLQKPLYVVINKTDTKAPGEVNKVEEHIKTTFAAAKIDVKGYIQYSKKEPVEKIMNKLQEVSGTNDTGDYLERVRDLVERLKDMYEYVCTQQSKERRGLKDQTEELHEDYLALVGKVADSCGRARGIPQYKERRFRGDIYQMDYSAGKRLQELLDDVSDNLMVEAQKKFVKYGEAMKSWEKAARKCVELEKDKEQLEQCSNNLTEKIKKIKDIQEGGR